MKPVRIVLAVIGGLFGIFFLMAVVGVGIAGVAVVGVASDITKNYERVKATVPKMTVADLEKGHPFRHEDRKAFLTSCQTMFGGDGSSCQCMTEAAGAELSHYERQTMMMIWESSPARALALAAATADLPQDKLNQATGDEMSKHLEAFQSAVISKCMTAAGKT